MSVDFSVVIPTYRRPKELPEAVESVMGQTGVSFEIIVVDDCPQGSAEALVAALHNPHVTYLKNSQPSGGVPAAVRNLALPHVKGRFLHFLDDDDIVPEGYYAAVKEAFEAHPEIGLVFGRVEPFGACADKQLGHERRFFANAARMASVSGRFGTRFAFASRMLFGLPLLVCSAGVVRKECAEHAAGFDAEIRMLEDADFFARIMRRFGAHFLDRVALRYRISFNSLMHPPSPSPAYIRHMREGRRRMRRKYRQAHGLMEFCASALFARTILRIVQLGPDPFAFFRDLRRSCKPMAAACLRS